MLTLYIDGKNAVTKADASIKLTRVNPFTDEQGDYTFDIELPLAGCPQNVAIFGAAHRAEIPKIVFAGRRYAAQIVAMPVALRGHIVVTQVTDALIKAQFLSGYSDLANTFTDADGADLYVDKLPGLGFAWEEECPWYYEGRTEADKNLPSPGQFVRAVNDYYAGKDLHESLDPDRSKRLDIFAGTRDKTSCVAFPIYATDESGKAYSSNDLSFWECGISETYEDKFLDGANTLEERLPLFNPPLPTSSVAPQPYISYIIKRVLRSLGFELGENELAGTWLDNLFLANPRRTLLLRDMLPHITVSEFFAEIAQYLGIYFDMEDGKVVMRRNRLRDLTERIGGCVAEYTDEIDAEAKGKTALTQNVRYDFEDKFAPSKQLAVPEKVYENSVVRIYKGDITDEDDPFPIPIYEYIAGAYEDVNKEDYANLITIDEATGAYSAKVKRADGKIVELEIDQLGMLVRNWADTKTAAKLKVIPATVIGADFSHKYKKKRPPTDLHFPNQIVELTDTEQYPALRVPYQPVFSNDFKIWKAVAGENQQEPTALSRIYIALNTGRNYHYTAAKNIKYHPVAVGAAYTKEYKATKQQLDNAGTISTRNVGRKEDYFFVWPIYFTKDKEGDRIEHCPFCLRETRQPSIPADAWHNISIDTRVEHVVQFADRTAAIDPTATYIIHGRRYVCHKLELEITERGLKPLKTGYFYELNNN